MSAYLPLEALPASCQECRLARLVPFHNYRDDTSPKMVYKCFWTKQIGTEEEGGLHRLSECPLRESEKREEKS